MKHILNLLALAAFVLSACNPSEIKNEGVKDPLQNYPDDHLKVMSFNIKVDNTDDQVTPNGWGLRKKACVQMIMDHYPTFIGLQEATYTNQWSWLKQELMANYDGFGVNRDTGLESGRGEVMGILYNRNQVEKLNGGTFWLSETPEQVSLGWGAPYNRTATWGLFRHKKTGKKIVYINTHLDHQVQEARFNGMKLIAKRLSDLSSEGDILLLTGDFNATADNEAFYHISSNMKNTRSSAPEGQTDNHTTFNNWKTTTNSIIDHIYVSNEVEVVKYSTVYQPYGGLQFLSDHYPVCALMKIQ
jgi:endonuclease/exonuclease/phosphatase family metal-dependent hydrolase